MCPFAVLLLAAAVAVPAAAAPPPGFYESRVLESAASSVAGKPARVYCALTDLDWRDTARANGTPEAFAITTVGSDVSRFEPLVCSTLRTRLARGPVSLYDVAASLRALVHEAIHQRGVGDEGQAECAAMHELPRVAVTFFGVEPGKQLRALMLQAWRSHRASPPAYRSVC